MTEVPGGQGSREQSGAAAVADAPATVVRLGAVAYLNAAPLLHGLETEPRFALERALPSAVAERLHAGEIDVGMIPSVEYARGSFALVPGVAIASRGAVRSVNLFLRGRLLDVRSVALDTSSRTSVALTRVLLRERLGRDPEYVSMAPDVDAMLERCDAALVIGDPALYYEGGAERLDLGLAWRELTGLPFVWAFWAGKPGALEAPDVRRLQRALGEGCAAFPEIARAWSAGDARREAVSLAYLRENMSYALGEAERAGLSEFLARAHAIGLVARVPELVFYGDRS